MHLFRRYLNNRGSALFMVISTMTAIMISCMAMYFSVVSSRSSQYAVFNQQQSKSAAVSISDAVLASMMDGSNKQFKTLLADMWKLDVGGKLTTNGNGFAAFDSSATGEDDPNLGSYMVEIVRVSQNTFDIVVTSSVNGVNDVYHTVIDLSPAEAAEVPPAPTQVFAATGYVPNDVFLEGGKMVTDLFFDNEMTYSDLYGGNTLQLTGDLSVGGSFTNNQSIVPNPNKATIVAIRGDYINTFNSSVKFAKEDNDKGIGRSIVLIGGNAYFYGSGGGGFENADVYINGNMYLKQTVSKDVGTNYYVNGNVILEGNIWPDVDMIYANGIVDASKTKNEWGGYSGGVNGPLSVPLDSNHTNAKTLYSWTESAGKDGVLGLTDMRTTLDEKTASNQYYKWIVDTSASTIKKKNIKFAQNTNEALQEPSYELKYQNGVETGCIVESLSSDGSNGYNDLVLIIDTGEDPDNIYTVSVKPNIDCYDKNGKYVGYGNGDGIPDTFSWYPSNAAGNTIMTVLVKGRGSVVIDVPQGVVYQDMTNLKVMHYGWYLLLGGEETTRNGKYALNTAPFKRTESEAIMTKFIHQTCTSGDGCTYTEGTSEKTCSIHTDTHLTTVTCTNHTGLRDYCKKCYPEKSHVGECAFHVDTKAIDDYLNSNDDIKKKMLDTKNKVIYPTTNIFLVSCEESAEFRFSRHPNGSRVEGNMFFGYVYAPYMTYKGYGDGAGNSVRLVGGMTVSDYILDDACTTMACWPDKMPTDLMSSESLKNQLNGLASKSWKISLNGH